MAQRVTFYIDGFNFYYGLRHTKLLLEMPLDELKQHTTFKGLNPLAEHSVLVALQRRYKVIKGS